MPTYVVYADTQRTSEQAQALLDALGMTAHLEEYKTRAFVLGPVNGVSYDAAADLAAFKELLRTRRSSNLKVIGVGQGATFVNNVISGYAFAVAGIMTYGGSVDARATTSTAVPAYVSAANPAVASLYRNANGASATEEDASGYIAYRNPGQLERLQRVVVSKRGSGNETLGEALRNAWQTVFSRNYRLYMIQYAVVSKPDFDPNNYTEPWLLEPYVMYDRLRVRYEAVSEELPNLGLSLRYDYVPERALAAAPRSVPLVVMLHGNNNDPRIQGESSGWVGGGRRAQPHPHVRRVAGTHGAGHGLCGGWRSRHHGARRSPAGDVPADRPGPGISSRASRRAR